MTEKEDENSPSEITRSGTVALLGRSNVGKSTLMNAALKLPLAIATPLPQTTRDPLLGVVRHAGAEIGLLDTPGIHRADTRLGKAMNKSARVAARDADVIAFIASVPKDPKPPLTPHFSDMKLLRQIDENTPIVLVLNKVDLLKNKEMMLPLLQGYARLREFAAVVPVSALKDKGIERVLDEVARLLPERGPVYDADTITDRPMRYFVSEYIREPILNAVRQEVPHAVAIVVEEVTEPEDETRAIRVMATIHVEREGQKSIMIGKGGEMLKRVGTQARERIEALWGRKIFLELWVRVTPNWRESAHSLDEFGLSERRDS